MRIEAATHIEADPARVWAALTHWESQAEWMVDARSVTVLSPHREGTGVVVRCVTELAPAVVVRDDFTTTEWLPERTIAVRHLGWLIRGIGAFELTPTEAGTRMDWWEEVSAPLGSLVDSAAELAVRPLVAKRFRASLARFKAHCEGRHPVAG
jgi:uncharacterized protein YndB with AHSA1/START domain